MNELIGTTIEDLIGTMKDRRVRIPSEIGAFIALEVCEALQDGPAAAPARNSRGADGGGCGACLGRLGLRQRPGGIATNGRAAVEAARGIG